MNRKLVRAVARTVALGGIVTLGLGSAQAAMAQPPDSYHLPCSTGALEYALAHVGKGDTIYLAPGCTYWLTAQLTTNVSDLTIVGEDSTLERAPYASSFTILVNTGTAITPKILTLDDVNFTNGGGHSMSAVNGGAIYNHHGTLSVNGGTFSDNYSDEYGGAINSYGSNTSLTVSDAYFTGNGGEYGGAIDNGTGSTATISDSTFSRNSAPGEYGGAIENDGLATITGSSFLGNTSEYGGAIYNDGDLTTADNLLIGNRSYEGGGIYNIGGGGGGPIIPADSTLTGNRSYEGGDIVNDANETLDTGTLTDDGSLIVYNAAYQGGGIYNGRCTTVTLTGTTIFGNVTDNVYNHGDC
jgi:predicted outer membrane repeat protein